MNDEERRVNGVVLEYDGARARISLNQPPVNALSRSLLEALSEALTDVARRQGIAVLHIRSLGRCFCAGADLNEMRVAFSGPQGARDQLDYVRRLQEVFAHLEDLPVVSVAEIGGAALGGGLELALACDVRLGAEEARLGLPEVALGLVPGAGGTQRLTRLCGQAVAKRLILGAEVVEGRNAVPLGLLHWAVPRSDLAGVAESLVKRLGDLPPAALGAAKRCIGLAAWPGERGFEEELSATAELMAEAGTRELVGEFLSRNG